MALGRVIKYGILLVFFVCFVATDVRGQVRDYGYRFDRVDSLMKIGKTIAALHDAVSLMEEVEKGSDAASICRCHLLLGKIYQQRRNYIEALVEYNEGLRIMQRKMHDESPAEVFVNISSCQISLKDYNKALSTTEMGMSQCSWENVLVNKLLEKRCEALYFLGRYVEFKWIYDEWIKTPDAKADASADAVVQYHIINGEWEKALTVARDELDSERRAQREYMVYYAMGDYQKAYFCLDSVRAAKLVNFQRSFSVDLENINETLETETLKRRKEALEDERRRLMSENNMLEEQNSRLALARSRLELEQTNSTIELQSVQIANNELDINNKGLELQQRAMELEKQQIDLQREESESAHTIQLFTVISIFILLMVVCVAIFLVQRERNFRALHKAHAQLVLAREVAEENQRLAEKSEKDKTAFIRSMSHEVRTPLNAICGFSQILADPDMQQGMTSDQKQGMTNLIVLNTELLTTLVNDMLLVSDLESGKYKMDISCVPCNDMCRQILVDVLRKHQDLSVEVSFATNAPNDFMITTDVQKTTTVLVNFLTNAIKQTEQGEITLQCILDENPGCVTFAVADTGNGVPPDKAEVIFNRFEKLDDFKQGTGLGLSICRLIADKMCGEVKLDMTYTDGARFVFIHPIDDNLAQRLEEKRDAEQHLQST